MKKLLKSVICGSMNSAYVHCSLQEVNICGYCSMNSSRKVWPFLFFSQSVHIVHCLWTHKFYFSTTFSLKICSTVQFIHLKIILLQYFSVFSFSFQLYPNRPLVSFYIMLVGSPHSAIFLGTSICLYYTCNANFYCRHIKKWQILYTFVNNIFYFSCV